MLVSRILKHKIEYNDNVRERKILGKPGQLHNNHIILSERLVKKILHINRINLPDELIDIIKDYLFYSCDALLHRMFTDSISNLFRFELCKDIRVLIGENDDMVHEVRQTWEFWMKPSVIRGTDFCFKRPLYHCLHINTCSACGNYAADAYYDIMSYSPRILCNCTDNAYIQSQNNVQQFRVKRDYPDVLYCNI